MVVVAIAGTGLIGTHIIRSLLSSGKHTVVLLTRSPQPELSALGALVKQVDYSSTPSLVSALSDPPVHTVISCMASFPPATMVQFQLNLLAAAKQAGAKRFAPSEFATTTEGNMSIQLYRENKTKVWRAAEESGLEVTAFQNGIFMNYLAHGSAHPNVKEDGLGGAPDHPLVVDLKEGKAEIPGTGKELVTFTRVQDVGKFVAAAVELDTWEKETKMAGDVATYDDVVRIAEEVTGRKIEVVKRSTDDLQKEADSKSDFMERFYIEASMSIGLGHGYVEPRLNKQVAVEPMGLREFITTFWGI